MSITPHLDKWLDKQAAQVPNVEQVGDYGNNREWWEPIVNGKGGRKYADWLCDHLGDAQEVMEQMWDEILRLRETLDEERGI